MWQQDEDHGGLDLPAESWCQLFLGGGGFIGEEYQKHGLIKRAESNNCGVVQNHGSSSWAQNSAVLQASSPRSSVTTSTLSTHSMLDFSAKPRYKPADHNNSSEGNSTETTPTLKKARVQGSSSPQCTLKVRKEKLGDRITALHQLVSPFGKTDTASVLQEAIGYIRFLQSQIEALSSPYLRRQRQRQRRKHPVSMEEEEFEKDLKSRGLCLVPVSFAMHVGGDDGADFWAAPSLAGGF